MDKAHWIENGFIYINGKELRNISTISWDKHPKFEGVYTKNLFTSIDSNNNLSAMIVKIEPNCEIGNHIHNGKSELHEIIDGNGIALINQTSVNYFSGIVSFIPSDVPHSIKAGDKGLLLLAKFTPPLN